jgi:hypothetical protein
MNTPPLKDSLKTNKGFLATENLKNFRSFSGISLYSEAVLKPNEKGILETVVSIDALQQEVLDSALWYRPRLMLIVYRDAKQEPLFFPTGKKLFPDYFNQIFVRMSIPDSLKNDKYAVRWGLEVNGFPEPTINSKLYTLSNRH